MREIGRDEERVRKRERERQSERERKREREREKESVCERERESARERERERERENERERATLYILACRSLTIFLSSKQENNSMLSIKSMKSKNRSESFLHHFNLKIEIVKEERESQGEKETER